MSKFGFMDPTCNCMSTQMLLTLWPQRPRVEQQATATVVILPRHLLLHHPQMVLYMWSAKYFDMLLRLLQKQRRLVFFYNCQTALHLKRMLLVLGHPQNSTPVKTDNGMTVQFVKDIIKNKCSKSWDVRFHWLTEKQTSDNFQVYWDKGQNNLVDYHTKHYSPTHH